MIMQSFGRLLKEKCICFKKFYTFKNSRYVIRDGSSRAYPRAWPEKAHCGAGLGKDIVARLVVGLAGQDRGGTRPKRDGPKRDAGKH